MVLSLKQVSTEKMQLKQTLNLRQIMAIGTLLEKLMQGRLKMVVGQFQRECILSQGTIETILAIVENGG